MKLYDLATVTRLCLLARLHLSAALAHVRAANVHNALAAAIGGAR